MKGLKICFVLFCFFIKYLKKKAWCHISSQMGCPRSWLPLSGWPCLCRGWTRCTKRSLPFCGSVKCHAKKKSSTLLVSLVVSYSGSFSVLPCLCACSSKVIHLTPWTSAGPSYCLAGFLIWSCLEKD